MSLTEDYKRAVEACRNAVRKGDLNDVARAKAQKAALVKRIAMQRGGQAELKKIVGDVHADPSRLTPVVPEKRVDAQAPTPTRQRRKRATKKR